VYLQCKKQPVVIGWQRYRVEDLIPQPDSQQAAPLVVELAREKGTMTGRECQLTVINQMVFNAGYCSCLEHLEPRISYYQVFTRVILLLEMMVSVGQRYELKNVLGLPKTLGFRRTQRVPGTWLAVSTHKFVLAVQNILTVPRHRRTRHQSLLPP